MNILGRIAYSVAAVAGLTVAAVPATAAWPERPVTMIVVFPAGGTTDLVARVVQPAFAEALGTDVVIRNVGGGGGTIGTAEIANARPDGYTIGLSPIGPMTTQPHLRQLPYDPIEGMVPLCRMYDSPVVFASAQGTPYESVPTVVKLAQEKPNGVTYGTPGPGSIPHVVMVALEQSAGLKLKHIPFPGTAAGVKALLGGTVDIYGDVANFVPQYDLRPLAVYASERMAEFPDVPTMKEIGYDLQYSIWGGLFAPAGTPAEAVTKLSEACGKAMAAAGVVDGMQKQQTPIAYLDAPAFGDFVKAEFEKNGRMLEAAGLKKN